MVKRFLPLALLVLIAVAVYASGLYRQLSLSSLREHENELRLFVSQHFVVALVVLISFAAACIAASIPVGTILTIAGGFIIGPWVSGSAMSLAATLGAIGSYLAVRSAVGESLRKRAERKSKLLARLMDDLEHHLFISVFTLRLIPLFPFWLVNVVAGLIRAPIRPFILATALGVLPETFIYAHIGAGLNRVFQRTADPKLTDLVDPGLGLALVALAATAIVGNLIARRIRLAAAAKSN